MRRLHVSWWLAWLTLTACTSPAPTENPRGDVLMQVGPGPDSWNDATHCPLPPTLTGIPETLDGTLLHRWPIQAPSVGCSVRPEGARFSVSGTVVRDPSTSFSLHGRLDRNTSELDVTFTLGGDTFSSTAPCTLDFTEDSRMDVMSGAIWSTVTCPRVADAFGATCFASAQFLLESCDP